MLLFTTVLFVNGNPVGYKAFKKENSIALNPAENPNREICPPIMSASAEAGKWHVSGTWDQDLIDQVIEDVTNNFSPERWTVADTIRK